MHDWYPFLRNISTSNFDLLSCAQCSQYLWFPRYTRAPNRSHTLLLLPLTLVIRTFTDKKWFINPNLYNKPFLVSFTVSQDGANSYCLNNTWCNCVTFVCRISACRTLDSAQYWSETNCLLDRVRC
eukprot:205973_1